MFAWGGARLPFLGHHLRARLPFLEHQLAVARLEEGLEVLQSVHLLANAIALQRGGHVRPHPALEEERLDGVAVSGALRLTALLRILLRLLERGALDSEEKIHVFGAGRFCHSDRGLGTRAATVPIARM